MSSDRLDGSPSQQSVEQSREARLVRIAHGTLAIGLDPFGMLDPQIVVNLLLELGVGVDLVIHGYASVKDLCVARDGSDKGFGGNVDEPWRPEHAVRPSKGIPKDGMLVFAVRTTLVQLDDCLALALQQHGKQSALRKGLG